jgi:hypothetical protein
MYLINQYDIDNYYVLLLHLLIFFVLLTKIFLGILCVSLLMY